MSEKTPDGVDPAEGPAAGPPPPAPPPVGPPPGHYGSGPAGPPTQPYGPPGGQPPAGPPPGSYGPGGYSPLPPAPQATDGFGFAWQAFKVHAGALVVGQLLWALVVLVVTTLWVVVLTGAGVFAGGMGSNAAAGWFAGFGILGIAVMMVVLVLASVFAAAGMSNAGLKLVRGEGVSVADFFKIPNPLAVLLIAIIGALAAAVLTFTIVGPLIMMFFAVYVVLFAIDQRQGAIEAITSGIKMALAFPGQTVVLILLSYVANLIGALICGVGTLVSLPLVAVATAWLYRSQLPLMQQQR